MIQLFQTKILTVFGYSLPKSLPFAGGSLPLPSLFCFSVGSEGKRKHEKERKARMTTQSEPTLPSNRAFVVQFRRDEPETPLECKGRVEHVVSGQAIHFQSWEHLQRFLEMVLAEIQAEPP